MDTVGGAVVKKEEPDDPPAFPIDISAPLQFNSIIGISRDLLSKTEESDTVESTNESNLMHPIIPKEEVVDPFDFMDGIFDNIPLVDVKNEEADAVPVQLEKEEESDCEPPAKKECSFPMLNRITREIIEGRWNVRRQMECPVCKTYQSSSSFCIVNHMRNTHGTTLKQMGLVFRCECGQEYASRTHSIKQCKMLNYTIVPAQGNPYPIVRREMECPLCMNYRSSSCCGFVYHLREKHSTCPSKAGIIFKCDCGNECASTTHSQSQCKILNFTIVRCEPKPTKVPLEGVKCILCESHPTTIVGYVEHLKRKHASTLKKNNIHLTCGKGCFISSQKIADKHSIYCSEVEFTVHQDV